MKKKIQQKKANSRFVHVSWLFCFVIGLLAVAVVFVTIQTATSGAELVGLDMEEKELITKKQNMLDEYAEKSSLTSIDERAEELGFLKPQNIFYAEDIPSVAKLP